MPFPFTEAFGQYCATPSQNLQIAVILSLIPAPKHWGKGDQNLPFSAHTPKSIPVTWRKSAINIFKSHRVDADAGARNFQITATSKSWNLLTPDSKSRRLSSYGETEWYFVWLAFQVSIHVFIIIVSRKVKQ